VGFFVFKTEVSALCVCAQLTKMVSSKDHPFHKFGTGNLETLDIGPKKRGVDTRDELVEFYTANYSSNLMRLVVYGRESVDELTDLVHNKFSSIKNTGRKAEKFTGQPCLPEHLQVKSVSSVKHHVHF
jgi:insulysin